jgi:DNA repair photolyase
MLPHRLLEPANKVLVMATVIPRDEHVRPLWANASPLVRERFRASRITGTCAIGTALIVHPMICHDANNGTSRHETADPLIDFLVEGVRLRLSGRIGVLHEVG